MSMDDSIPIKKRSRLRGACDMCRERKIKCDSTRMPGNLCSNCVVYGWRCTHVQANKGKKASSAPGNDMSPPESYKSMSHKIFDDFSTTRAKVAAIMSPNEPHYTVPDDKVVFRQILVEISTYVQALELALSSSDAASPTLEQAPPEDQAQHGAQGDHSQDHALIEDQFKMLTLTESQYRSRFFGKSSNVLMIKAAVDMRQKAFGHDILASGNKNPSVASHWFAPPRYKYMDDKAPPVTFPEPPLLRELIDLYFARFNPFFPIFHRPTFEKDLADGLHLKDGRFGALVLAICSLASEYPRENSETFNSWSWFSQVQRVIGTVLVVPTIHTIQLYCVSILYLQGISNGGMCWMLLGMAVRLLQDVGAHRKAPPGTPHTVEDELWKRAFWGVMATDIFISAILGRPRATNPDDYDQDFPADCDDEYWEIDGTTLTFKQPSGIPSRFSGWLCLLKLLNILGAVQDTIYTANKSDSLFNRQRSDKEAIVKIDSALNQWLENLPEHVRWDPHRQDDLFFEQSALLYSTYYYVQIMVHKPFIPASKDVKPTTPFPSITICTNAARSCIHIIEVQAHRSFIPMPPIRVALVNSVVMLMLNHWSGHRMGLASKNNSDIERSMSLLRLYKRRWKVASRLSELLESIGNDHMDQMIPSKNLKRSRQDDGDLPDAKKSATGIVDTPSSSPLEQRFDLPFRTDELGRSPIYGVFDFRDNSWLPNPSQPATDSDFSGEGFMSQQSEEVANMSSQTDVGYNTQELPSMWDTQTMGLFNQVPYGDNWEDWMNYLSSVQQLMGTNDPTYN